MKAQQSKTHGHSKSSCEREVYGNITLPRETRKISNKCIHTTIYKRSKQQGPTVCAKSYIDGKESEKKYAGKYCV